MVLEQFFIHMPTKLNLNFAPYPEINPTGS